MLKGIYFTTGHMIYDIIYIIVGRGLEQMEVGALSLLLSPKPFLLEFPHVGFPFLVIAPKS